MIGTSQEPRMQCFAFVIRPHLFLHALQYSYDTHLLEKKPQPSPLERKNVIYCPILLQAWRHQECFGIGNAGTISQLYKTESREATMEKLGSLLYYACNHWVISCVVLTVTYVSCS